MKKVILVFLAFLIAESAFAQNTAIAKEAAKQADTNYDNGNLKGCIVNYLQAIEGELVSANPDSVFLANANYYLGYLYSQTADFGKAIVSYRKAVEIARTLNLAEGQGMVLKALGKLFASLSNFTDAIESYSTAYNIAFDLNNISEQEVCLNDLGLIYYYSGNLDQALKNFNQALKLTEQLKEKPVAPIIIMNNIGLVHIAKGNYQTAINYYDTAIYLHDSLKLTSSLIMQYINIATCYNYLNDQEKSIDYYNKALIEARESANETEEAQILASLGLAYYQWGQYDLAMKVHSNSLNIYQRQKNELGIAMSKNNLAMVMATTGGHVIANKYYREALDLFRVSGDLQRSATILNNLGEGNNALGNIEEALSNFNESLTISKSVGLKTTEAISLNNIGAIYYSKGDFLSALENFSIALDIFYTNNMVDYISIGINNVGNVHKSLGEFDEAILSFEESYSYNILRESVYNQALALNNIGVVYMLWGKYEKALDYYKQAKYLSKENGIKYIEATTLNNIGLVYTNLHNYEKASLNYDNAYSIAIETEDKATQALILNNIGFSYFSDLRLDEALLYFRRTLQLNEELGTENGNPAIFVNIGKIFNWKEHYDTAYIYFSKALQITQSTGDKYTEAGVLNSMGSLYYNKKQYREAVSSYEASLKLKEQIRKTATGDTRVDFLAENIDVYYNLISTYIELNDAKEAFRISEQSKARYLLDQLGADTTWDGRFGYKNISLPAHSLVISFANTNWSDKVVFSMKPQDTVIHAVVVSDTNFFKQDFSDETMENDLAFIPSRGATVLQNDVDKKGLLKGLVEDENFDEIINYYRLLLSNPNATNKKSTEKIGRALYDYLIKPIEAELAGVENLIIVPDGPLSNIPFECLIDENGYYLAESYTIGYTPSVSVLNYLEHRTYDKKRFAVLAVGNPAYTLNFTKNDTLETREELMAFRKQVDYSIAQNEALGQYYGNLRYGEWPGLPGTEKEIDEIAQTYGHADTLTGEQAAERNIKALSDSGKLKQYNLLHFATHGITIPEAPELSALVLTQVDTDTVDDGYLTMGEIANLSMEADFVNLSACETGLGKIYGGEGVVGLTQAFMVAGANGLSVSLWQVGDESTALFMTELYKLLSSTEIGYVQAMTEIKRRFIQGEYGEKYSQPFYWGAFVYYGKE